MSTPARPHHCITNTCTTSTLCQHLQDYFSAAFREGIPFVGQLLVKVLTVGFGNWCLGIGIPESEFGFGIGVWGFGFRLVQGFGLEDSGLHSELEIWVETRRGVRDLGRCICPNDYLLVKMLTKEFGV